ncbi:MAG: hypothetical protein PVF73_07045 [Bacteroidales bacterium]|jgi:hypothetical protein
MVKLIKYKLKGSILEPLIALMIIFFSITASFFVVTNARDKINIKQTARAMVLADRVLSETLMKEDFLDTETEEEGLRMERTIGWYDMEHGLLLVSVRVYDNKDKLIAGRQRIIIADETEVK